MTSATRSSSAALDRSASPFDCSPVWNQQLVSDPFRAGHADDIGQKNVEHFWTNYKADIRQAAQRIGSKVSCSLIHTMCNDDKIQWQPLRASSMNFSLAGSLGVLGIRI